MISLLIMTSSLSQETEEWVKKHSCAKQECPEGRCHFENCKNPTSCSGGLCRFENCEKPSCDGGLCTFKECTHPRCAGGKCNFLNTKVRYIFFSLSLKKKMLSHPFFTQTTLMHGFCSGGICMVDNEVVESNMQDQLAY